MARSKTLFATSSVVAGGLTIAWAIVTGVTCGKSNSFYQRRRERYELLRDMGGESAAAKAEVNDAVNDGTISKEVGKALTNVIETKGPGSTGVTSVKVSAPVLQTPQPKTFNVTPIKVANLNSLKK